MMAKSTQKSKNIFALFINIKQKSLIFPLKNNAADIKPMSIFKKPLFDQSLTNAEEKEGKWFNYITGDTTTL